MIPLESLSEKSCLKTAQDNKKQRRNPSDFYAVIADRPEKYSKFSDFCQKLFLNFSVFNYSVLSLFSYLRRQISEINSLNVAIIPPYRRFSRLSRCAVYLSVAEKVFLRLSPRTGMNGFTPRSGHKKSALHSAKRFQPMIFNSYAHVTPP